MRLSPRGRAASIGWAGVVALMVCACSSNGGTTSAMGGGASDTAGGGTTAGGDAGTSTGTPGDGTGTGGLPGSGSTCSGSCPAVVLEGVAVAPASVAIPIGLQQAFTAIAIYSDGSRRDVSAAATWTTSDAAVASIDAAGFLAAGSAGAVTVTATFQGIAASAALTVSAAVLTSIAVTPTAVGVPAGVAVALMATGVYSDQSSQDVSAQVAWATGDAAVATVTPAGRLSGLATGTTTVTATFAGVSASAPVTVTAATLQSIAVSPGALPLAASFSDRLTATGTYSDGTSQDITAQVAWTSSAPAVAGIDGAGRVTALAPGSASILATLGGRTVEVPVTVTSATLVAVQVTPDLPSVPAGMKVAFTATGVFSDQTSRDLTASVLWTVSDASVATLSATGVASGRKPGATTITATLGAASDSTTLTITPATLTLVDVLPPALSIAKGTEGFLQAMATYSDGFVADVTSQAAWTSDGTAVAVSVDARGAVVTANAITDAANVKATFGGISDVAAVTVTAATLRSIAVDPGSVSLPTGLTQQLVATGAFSDASTQDLTAEVAWTSSDSTVATVSASGVVTAVRPGTATITASFLGVSASSTAAVTASTLQSVAVTPAATTLAIGYKVQLVATARYSDGSTHDVTAQVLWSSSNASVLAVSNAGGSKGLATGIAAGTVTVTAKLGTFAGTATAQVAATKLASISIAPANPTVAAGTTLQLRATGTFDDGSTLDVTRQCSWQSSSKRIARVSQAGVLTASKKGAATITATHAGRSGSTTATVN